MYCSSHRRRPRSKRGGFTLTELLVVILILALLVSLLLPAINGALRTAKNAAVSAEINQLAQALANFKSTYNDYPPSRIYLAEDGDYSAANPSSAAGSVAVSTVYGTGSGLFNSKGNGDITVSQLAQRSLAALRKFFPRVNLSTSGAVYPTGSKVWYDFNGDGVNQAGTHYILSGHECLVFFLGGIVNNDGNNNLSMTGFAKDPTNPFVNSVFSTNRTPPKFEFNGSRLFLDPNNTSMNGSNPGIPGYYDSLGNSPPLAAGQTPTNFYAYFSAYGSNGYDPNDVNFPETDGNGSGPIELFYTVGFPVFGTTGIAESEGPNPYTTTSTITTASSTTATNTGVVTYLNPQSFQIISAGVDGLFGVGGQYNANPTGGATSLPFDSVNTYDGNGSVTSDANVRLREQDNLTNVKGGTLR